VCFIKLLFAVDGVFVSSNNHILALVGILIFSLENSSVKPGNKNFTNHSASPKTKKNVFHSSDKIQRTFSRLHMSTVGLLTHQTYTGIKLQYGFAQIFFIKSHRI
jgi:hypothetical protein